MDNSISIIPLGGVGDVTRNMYLYEYKNEILIVDCGIGFADETMLGVDLLLPDITYLLKSKKKIVGMLLSHGHEDHIGATPFILPQLFSNGPQFPVFAAPFAAELTNEKLKEYKYGYQVKAVPFTNPQVRLGSFAATFIHVTHSVPDTSHIFIETPAGNFYHGSDFKFDNTPSDGQKSDYEKIQQLSQKGVVCLLSDCLGAEKAGRAGTEAHIGDEFDREIGQCSGKVIITTFSSHVARINQIIDAAVKHNRKICFSGRSLMKVKEVGKRLGYLHLEPHMEIELEQAKNYQDKDLVFIVAGAQGQEGSGMNRIVTGEHKEIKLRDNDTVIISADPIPGSELLAYGLIDEVAKKGIRVVYSGINKNIHVSGHGSQEELSQLMSLVKPKKLFPIGGNFRHMAAYSSLAQRAGYTKSDVILPEDGQEIIFANKAVQFGRMIPVKTVYVDQLSGGEMESYVLRDRQKLSEGGIAIVIAEIEAATGKLIEKPDIIMRGFTGIDEQKLRAKLYKEFVGMLSGRRGRVTDWVHIRKQFGGIAERMLARQFKARPLVLPIVIEV